VTRSVSATERTIKQSMQISRLHAVEHDRNYSAATTDISPSDMHGKQKTVTIHLFLHAVNVCRLLVVNQSINHFVWFVAHCSCFTFDMRFYFVPTCDLCYSPSVSSSKASINLEGTIRYDTIEEFNVDSKDECDQLNLAHVARKNI